MKRIAWWGAALAVAAVLATPQAAGAAAGATFAEQARAAGLSRSQADQLQARVDEALAGMKVGARQISANEIVSQDGLAKLVIPLPGERRARPLSAGLASSACAYGHLCLYNEENFNGLFLDLSGGCGFVNMGEFGANDRLESYINNQASGRVARFYDWQGSWVQKFTSVAPHSDYDLNRWSGFANVIDAVRNC